MTRNLPAAFLALALFAALSLAAGGAGAYVLPGQQILEFTAKAMGNAKSLSATELLILLPGPSSYTETAMAPEGKADGEGIGETAPLLAQPGALSLSCGVQVYYRFPGSYRDEARCPQMDLLYVHSGDRTARIVGGMFVDGSEGPLDSVKDLLLFRSAEPLAERLSLLGVDLETTSMGRWNNRITWVLGALYPDETVPQVWIDRETRLPVRWIVTRMAPASNRAGLDVRFENWTNLGTQNRPFRVPGRTQIFQDGRLIRERTLVRAEMDPALSPALFDLSAILRDHPPPEPENLPENHDGPPDEVRKAIEDFRDIYR
ncbi:MAG: hypothetical protein ABIJ95_07310 [Pseudomonadota bacterium]